MWTLLREGGSVFGTILVEGQRNDSACLEASILGPTLIRLADSGMERCEAPMVQEQHVHRGGASKWSPISLLRRLEACLPRGRDLFDNEGEKQTATDGVTYVPSSRCKTRGPVRSMYTEYRRQSNDGFCQWILGMKISSCVVREGVCLLLDSFPSFSVLPERCLTLTDSHCF